jgi:NADPH-dependent 2,4-dienoyl-CoA reductase/sulfur reductase-like enzyme
MQLMVVGGSDAGISAGLRARELDPTVEVTVLVADRFPNFSICGLPYHVSGDVPDWHQLAHRSLEDLEATGMRLLLDHTAHRIDPAVRQIAVTGPRGHKQALGYDRLVVGTGAVPARPPIPGLDLPGVHLLHSMADVFAVQHSIKAGQPRRAVIVGAGYIGLEMAEAFTSRELEVTVVEQAPAAMPTVDPELGEVIGRELAGHGVRLATGVTVRAIHPDNGGLAIFAGSLGTQVVKVFELAVARTGLRDAEAAAAGYDPVTVGSVEFDHKAYYPGARQLHLRITGDRTTGRLLGAQLVGHHHAQVAKRIDIPATALFHDMTVQGLSDLDLSYTPPFGSPWDAVQMAAQTWTRAVRGGRPTQAATHQARP